MNLIQAIAKSIHHALIKNIYHVPGHGGTEVYNELESLGVKPRLCFNEEAALSMASGSSLYGMASCLLVKSHGLAKMANAMQSTLSMGVTFPLLVFVFDDTLGKSSDNILDTHALIKGLEVPSFDVDTVNPLETFLKAYQYSYERELPVVLYVDCQDLQKETSISDNIDIDLFEKFKDKIYQRNPYQHIVCPLMTQYHRELLKAKLKGTERKNYPKSPEIKELPKLLPPHLLKTYERYSSFFHEFEKIEKDFVSADAGTSALFGFDPFSSVHACSYMGGSPGMALGAYHAGASRVWSISGDFSFYAAGILGLQEAYYENAPLNFVLFSNGVAQATGGQRVEPRALQLFLKSFQGLVTRVDIDDQHLLHEKLHMMQERRYGPEILLLDCL